MNSAVTTTPVAGVAPAGVAQMALPVEDFDPAARRYGVLVGGQRLLLSGDGAVRVLQPPPVFRLPNTRAWFQGLSNVRGTLVPVYDLAAWLALPPPESGRMLLVIGEGESAAGILVDDSPRHLMLGPDASAGAALGLPSELLAYAGETFSVAGAAWTAVDWNELFEQLKTLALAAE